MGWSKVWWDGVRVDGTGWGCKGWEWGLMWWEKVARGWDIVWFDGMGKGCAGWDKV